MFQWVKNLLIKPEERPVFGARSGKWEMVRKQYLTNHPRCAVCNTKENLEVHHVLPYHLYPEQELKIENLITLCSTHHLFVGHLMNWSSYNVDVRNDSAKWLRKIMSRPCQGANNG